MRLLIMSTPRYAEFAHNIFLYGLGMGRGAATTLHHVGRHFRCSIHDVKQRTDHTTLRAARLRCIASRIQEYAAEFWAITSQEKNARPLSRAGVPVSSADRG